MEVPCSQLRLLKSQRINDDQTKEEQLIEEVQLKPIVWVLVIT